MMMREQRAKQFMPFDAMKGLSEALHDREEKHSRVSKHEICEEDQERISETLFKIEKGSKAFVSFYSNFHDWETEGMITEVNRPYRFIRIRRLGSNDEEKIFFDDLYDIRVIG